MSLARRLARAQRNGNGALGTLASSIQGLQTLGGGLEKLGTEAQAAAMEAKAALDKLSARLQVAEDAADRQRAVFLRVIADIGKLRGELVDVLGRMEEYEAEYEALRFLCWVVMLGREDP